MIRNRIVLKFIAIFCAIEILSSTLLPSITFALTAGPTVPEATSFEPVDTTDMVNLVGGEFAYSLPLVEVPGPSGGYPLSLSYHAGLSPNEEASWVGLGWTLNPGSLNRIVNGHADDLNGSKFINRSFWEGGERRDFTVGVSVGIANVATVTAGLEFSHDTYQGYGTGGYMGLGLGYTYGNATIGVQGMMGTDAYGNGYSSVSGGVSFDYGPGSVGATYSKGGLTVEASYGRSSVGITSSKGNVTAHASLNLDVVGANISTDSKPSFTLAGYQGSLHNAKAGKISTRGSNRQVDIPLFYFNLHLGRKHIRYWIDESVDTYVYGSLFQQNIITEVGQYADYKSFDAFSIPDPTNDQVTYAHVDLEKQLGGTFADYDAYFVNAQGVGGAIKPYHYWTRVNTQNKKSEGQPYKIMNYNSPLPNPNYTTIDFRFANDFSNKLRYNEPDITVIGPDANGGKRLQFSTTTPTVGHDPAATDPHAPGSQSIRYFTNDQINNNLSNAVIFDGFVNCVAKGFDRTTLAADGKIGAFMITNASGVSYHFALPAYSYDEHTYSGNIGDTDGDTFNSLAQPNKYAYTWYLTAVTGPDYVDRNANHLVDAADWGYWVSFEYGKWTDSYRWRNPGEGYHKDIDPNFQNFSKGKKELYFLNAIKTASHTAYFVKELRYDAKSANPDRDIAVNVVNRAIEYQDAGIFNDHVYTSSNVNYNHYPTSSLRLKSIHLFENKDITWADPTDRSSGYSYTNYQRWQTYGTNVIDVNDIQVIGSAFNTKAIRSVELNTDYSLCPGVPNSFISGADAAMLGTSANPSPKGKLTLNSITFKGKSGVSAMPDLKFEYDLNDRPALNVAATLNGTNELLINATSIAQIRDNYKLGDLVSFTQTGSASPSYGYVKSITSDGNTFTIKGIDGTTLSNATIASIIRTKNAPYKKEFTDMWGSYKVDYSDIAQSNLGKITTKWSAPNVDVWSLQKIKTQLGGEIKIKYESDTYSKSAYGLNHSLVTSSLAYASHYVRPGTSYSNILLNAEFNAPGIDLRDFFTVGQTVDFWGLLTIRPLTGCSSCYSPIYMRTAKVISIGSNTMQIEYQSTFPFDQMEFHSYGGNLFFQYDDRNYGGGLRVNSISVYDAMSGQTRETSYQYEFLESDGTTYSSGSTAYEPLTNDYTSVSGAPAAFQDEYKRQLRKELDDIMRLSRFLPAPGVLYGKVRVNEHIRHAGQSTSVTLPGYKVFEFETFNKSLVDGKIDTDQQNLPHSGGRQGLLFSSVSLRKLTIKDYTSRIGELKKFTSYSSDGVKLSETSHKYLHDQDPAASFDEQQQKYEPLLAQFNEQGVIDESFDHARFAYKITDYEILGLISRKQSFPSIHLGTIVKDFKTGITSETTKLKFDMLSGAVLESITSDGYGNYFLSEVTPAYKVYPKMGHRDIQNSLAQFPKHMLSQEAANTVYKVDGPTTRNKVAVTSASVQTWSENITTLNATYDDMARGVTGLKNGIWRQYANYAFAGNKSTPVTNDGLLPIASYSPFDFNNSSANTAWDRSSQTTLYDVYSHALEAVDFNGIYASRKMTQSQLRIAAAGSNAQYKEIAYSGAEDPEQVVGTTRMLGQGVSTTGTIKATAHTGLKGVEATTSKRGFQYSFDPDSKTYRVSVWASGTNASIKYQFNTGAAQTATLAPIRTVGSWNLLVADIPANGSSTSMTIWCLATSGTVVFDDFRVHPYNTPLTTYVFNDFGEVSFILDANNLFTQYKYDAAGRLIEVQNESFQYGVKKASEITYHFANQ